ncbi:MAG: 23S rRNA (guanosine(2251)-2'-O)-methyltransferase RlmB [Bacillota bacterium]|nr:23S rRNA (guanosine(2251)-2'-O)-methyltransferase RlmB [Bacillota bacterium]
MVLTGNNGEFDLVEGRNPVMEVLKSGREVERIYAAKGLQGAGKRIIEQALDMGVRVEYSDRGMLDSISVTGSHQGIIAEVSKFRYSEDLEGIINGAREKGEAPLVIILDKITDPHNLGAIIRTANCCGAHAVIIPRRNSAGVNSTVIKASAGAVEHIPVVQVTNLVRAIEELKGMGLWIAGADMEGESMYNADLKGALGLVIGSEGKGISRLVKGKCDFIVSIPMKGEISSLNASVAAGVLMYEILRHRLQSK